MIRFKAPDHFQFDQTVSVLQRGPFDPINRVEAGKWTRCFRLPEQVVLIECHGGPTIHTSVLHGRLSAKAHRALIEEALGLDDPILLNRVMNIPHAEKLAGVMGLTVPGYPDVFEALVQIIMGQQVSVLVANKMRANFATALGGDIVYEQQGYKHFPYPQRVLMSNVDELRSLGLSQVKCKAILGLAEAAHSNGEWQAFTQQSDSGDIRALLTGLYGIGDWTVDWLLLRSFRRFDVIPSTDLAVRKAFTWWLNEPELMSMGAVKHYEKTLYPYGGVIAYRVLCAYGQALKRQGDV